MTDKEATLQNQSQIYNKIIAWLSNEEIGRMVLTLKYHYAQDICKQTRRTHVFRVQYSVYSIENSVHRALRYEIPDIFQIPESG